jgi:RNA polymerase sigma-70 factor (ECF subfamily)
VREADAQDAAQEVFLVVHRKLEQFEGRAKLTTWLFRICMRVASDHQRRAHVRREVVEDAPAGKLRDPAPDAETQAVNKDALRALSSALSKMDLDARAVFVLFELEAMSGADIANALGIPLGTVHSRLRRARETFLRHVARVRAEPFRPILSEGA